MLKCHEREKEMSPRRWGGESIHQSMIQERTGDFMENSRGIALLMKTKERYEDGDIYWSTTDKLIAITLNKGLSISKEFLGLFK